MLEFCDFAPKDQIELWVNPYNHRVKESNAPGSDCGIHSSEPLIGRSEVFIRNHEEIWKLSITWKYCW